MSGHTDVRTQEIPVPEPGLTPETVIERLRELRDLLGVDGVLAEINSGGNIPPEGVKHSLRLLCEQVMPAFR